MSATPAQTPSNGPPPPAPVVRAPLLAKLNLAVLGVFLATLSARLWPDWQHNPDLSHGLLMPVVFLILLYESRSAGPARWLRPGIAAGAGFAALLIAGLLALAAAGLYAAALGWTHSVVNFSLTASLALLLGAALVAFSSDTVRLVPFNWSAFTAVALWLLCAPIPPGTYSRLTLGLQLRITENVLRSLHVLGVAAARHGNIIELAQGAVGIEEACSGVRSLISCIFAGLFFSATLVRRPWARALIIGLSAPLALLMNFIRSLTLTLLAAHGTNIAGTWHDATGFAVLGVTAVCLGGLALLLERGEKSAARSRPPTLASPLSAHRSQLGVLSAGLVLALALTVVFVLNTRPSDHRDAPVPDLLAVLPAAPAGWLVETSTDLHLFRDVLQTDNLAQRTYTRAPTNGRPGTQIIIYLAYWRPNQASVSLVASHTPDACWPGSGWEAQSTPQTSEQPVVAGRALAPAEYRFFKSGDFPQYVWFWHLFDGRPIAYRDPYSASELLRIAWRYGFRRDGAQLFVRVSSNRPWREIVGEPLLTEFFDHTQPLGL
jgi:exosortase